MQKFSVIRLIRRGWMVLVAVAVVAAAGGAVYRLHGIFGSQADSAEAAAANEIKPFNPKRITLEVFGDPGTVATINYVDLKVEPQEIVDAPLPWSLTMVTTQPGAFTNLVAQGNGRSLGCRITVDDEVKDERVVSEVKAYTYCLVKSA